jgi:hypothetical protein
MAGQNVGQFQYMNSDNDGTSWSLLPEKPRSRVVSIACALPGEKALLPLPTGSARLEQLPDFLILSSNHNGTVLAEQSGLVIFDAHYGPGATIDAPFDPETDLRVPDIETAGLEEVIAQMQPVGGSREEKLAAISGFFAERFDYSLWQRLPRPNDTNRTALGRFLLDTRSGHCEYFATGTVLLLRRLGIPARYAVGYAVHEGSGTRYVARQRDAHAWCLVWNNDTATWEDFDTTPGSWIEAEAGQAPMFQWLGDAWSRLKFEIAKIRWGQTDLRRYLLWVLIPGLLFLLYQIVFRRRKRSRKTQGSGMAATEWPGLDSEFYRLEKRLVDLGFERHPGESASSWLERIAESAPVANLQGSLKAVVQLHYRLRFDPRGISEESRATLRRQVQACLEGLAKVRVGTARS